ncbi:MAG: hypothetical protein AAGC55_11035, partial [Myxococcota bacterium]
RAYLASGGTPELGVFDVSDPANPQRLGSFVAPGENTALHDLSVFNGRAYLNGSFGGFYVVDTLADPDNATLIGQWAPEVPAYSHSSWVITVGGRTIAVHGDEGYDAHIKIIDVDPESPEFMQQIGDFKLRPEVSVHNIMASGNLAYFANYQDGVRIVDLSDPTNPQQVAYYNTWTQERSGAAFFEGAIGIDLDLERGLIYVTDTTNGLMILRIIE